jgi:hypothetical protein
MEREEAPNLPIPTVLQFLNEADQFMEGRKKGQSPIST